MKKIFLILFILICFCCKQSETIERTYKRGDLVYFNNKPAVIVDYGSGTDWEIKILDCNKYFQDCYLNVNEGDLRRTK